MEESPRSIYNRRSSWIEVSRSNNSRRRWILFAFACLTTTAASGLVYGWPAFRQQLLQEGSDNDDDTLNEKQLGAIFTVGAWSSQGGRFFAGLARDHFGTRTTACLCILCAALGTLGLALCSATNVAGLAISLFAVGLGAGAQLCVQPVAGLFVKNAANVLFVLTGAFLTSGLVFLVLAAIARGGSSRAICFGSYSAFLVCLTIVGFVLLPKGASFLIDSSAEEVISPSQKFDTKEDESTTSLTFEGDEEAIVKTTHHNNNLNQKDDNERTLTDATEEEEEEPKIQEEEVLESTDVLPDEQNDEQPHERISNALSETATQPAPPTALQQLISLEYALLCLWFSICIVPLQYYVGSIGFQLERKGDDSGFYTNLFSVIYALVAVVAPLAGYVADRFGVGLSQALATVLTSSALFMLALDTVSLNVHVVGMILYGLARLYVYSTFFANVGKRFGYHNFGTLSGTGLLASSLVSLLQYPLIAWADDGYDVQVNVGCGIAVMALLPYCFWLYHRERKGLLD